MKKSTDKNAKLRATVFAEALKATDAEDFKVCIKDMEKLAETDPESAKIVASAIRAKQIPAMARNAGLNEELIQRLLSPLGNQDKAIDFAKKKETEESEESPFEKKFENEESEEEPEEIIEPGNDLEEMDENPETDELSNGFGEENDEGETATINIEVPMEMVDEVKEGLETFFAEKFGIPSEKETEFDTPQGEAEIETELPKANPLEEMGREKSEDPIRSEEMGKEALERETSASVDDSDIKTALAKRKAYREALLTKIAENDDETEPKDIGLGKDTDSNHQSPGGSEGKRDTIKPKDIGLGKDTSFNGTPFKFQAEVNEGEVQYPKMTLEGSAGNSLYDDPGYAKIPIPTKNPESLQLKDSYEKFTFSGGDDGSLDFTADFEAMNEIPSAGETASDKLFEVPTQISLPKNKTTVAKKVVCSGCDNPEGKEVEAVECNDCHGRLTLCGACQDEGYCPSCVANYKLVETTNECEKEVEAVEEGPTFQLPEPTPSQPVDKYVGDVQEKSGKPPVIQQAEVFQARIATAYKVATQLALAEIIMPDEIDDQVKLWMDDGLSAKAMKTQGALMLRSASNAAQRIAAASQTKNVRTASKSVSTNPSFVGGTSTNLSSIQDMQEALTDILMKPYRELAE
jgi:hypothetical protein